MGNIPSGEHIGGPRHERGISFKEYKGETVLRRCLLRPAYQQETIVDRPRDDLCIDGAINTNA